MAINTDGPKKQGRFLKKNSKLLNALSLVDFNFEQICTQSLVSFDNIDRTIIHSKFHNPTQLSQIVKPHATMDNAIHDSNQPKLGVIFPEDFTQDWHNERLNSKRRALGIEEDEEIDVLEQARHRSYASLDRTNSGNSADHKASDIEPHAQSEGQSEQQYVVHASSPEAVRAPETDGKVKTLNEGDMANAINKTFVPHSHDVEAADKNHPDSFSPLPTDSSSGPLAAEDRAIESWKVRQQIAKQNEQMLDELKSEARAEGFQNGFREGEERGLLSGQKNAAQVFSKVSEILTEFSGLKGLILDNVQKNFYELSQAIGEALVGREFSIKPEAYATMIQRVIKDTIVPNEFKVRMHPDTWQKVHDLGIADLESHLVKDNSITIGDFRVESALTVVDVNAKKLVSQLLEKADINLFDEKKVG
jgi:flagellar biosynthesis/type III secretory pathway protein FliH